MAVGTVTALLMLGGPAVLAQGQRCGGLLEPPCPPPTQPPPQPPSQPAPAPAPKATPPTTARNGPGGDGGPEKPGPKTIPPGARSNRTGPRTGPNNTKRMLDAIQPLLALGLSREQAIEVGFGRFPIAGPANFTDDFGDPRFTPYFHWHQGTDIFADCGMPVRSPADGVFTTAGGGAGGTAAYVRGGGTEYYLAHLKGYARNVRSGQRVTTGQIIGYNGNSGNAVGGACHVHFEVHPGGRTVNPKPILDQWIKEALANMSAVIASFEKGRPQAVIATGLTRRLADGRDGFLAAPNRPSRSELLWASSASPSGGSLHLAEAEAEALASEIDWTELARRREEDAQAVQVGDARARAVLMPLTPKLLRGPLGLEGVVAGSG